MDTSDRILATTWGDWDADGTPRDPASNFIVVADGNGNVVETWAQWDSILERPHQIYVDPYDLERHVWVVERGLMQILKFTNDGSELVMRLGERDHPTTVEEARANPNPGPYTYGQPSVMAFLPDGSFYVGDGYWHSRIIKYTADGEYVMEWGEPGDGPGQFDLIHGLAVDQDRRVYVADRSNSRIQVFTEEGEFIQEWPDILAPANIHIDEDQTVWVLDRTLNRVLRYNRDGELLDNWGAFGTGDTWSGGLATPHQFDIGEDGAIYIANFGGRNLAKFIPKARADPNRLVGLPFLLPE